MTETTVVHPGITSSDAMVTVQDLVSTSFHLANSTMCSEAQEEHNYKHALKFQLRPVEAQKMNRGS